MDQLIEFFGKLKGDHIQKNNDELRRSCLDGSSISPIAEGIDCCDVIDTCCDNYEDA